MSLDEKKAVVHAFAEVVSSHDLTRLDSVVGEQYLQHRSDVASGREPVRHYFAELLIAFPDLIRTDEDIIAEGDKVWVRTSYRGTHLGPYRGVQPTGRQIGYRTVDIFRISEGKLVEHWDVVDQLDMLTAIGALVPASLHS
jgi:predicted SnoaL-like aldol condensation-catalyzing enzyme